jgi:hypothetical protein
MPTAYHIDYETFSSADLKKLGAFRYAESGDAEILIAAVATDTEGPYLWVNEKYGKSDPRATALIEKAFSDPEAELWAHNAQFESVVTKMLWKGTQPKLEQWRCTAALARKAGLKASLEDVAIELGLKQKKMWEGYTLIRKFCVPQKNKKTGEETRIYPEDEPEAWKKFCDYCVQDVRTEIEVYKALRPIHLKGDELKAFQLDMRLNHRGIPVNIRALKNARKILQEVLAESSEEFQKITGLQPTQRDRVLEFFKKNGVGIENMRKKTLAAWLDEDDETPEEAYSTEGVLKAGIRRAVELYQNLGYAAPKKVLSMLALASPDARVRGTLLWYGAGTGRSSGVKMQPQNFKKPEFTDAGLAFKMIEEGAPKEHLDLLWGNPLRVIASCIRNFITGPLADADFAAIEARLVFWFAGQEDALALLRSGGKIYEDMAGYIFGVPASEIRNPSYERDLGKSTILGCFSADTEVLTRRGWVPIISITAEDWLWDGLDWVQSDGAHSRGWKPVLDLAGVRVTPEHRVLCGETWIPAQHVARDERSFTLALETASGNLPYQAFALGSAGESASSWSNAPAERVNTGRYQTTSFRGRLVDARYAHGPQECIHESITGVTRTSCPTTRTESGCLTGFQVASRDATTQKAKSISTTDKEGFMFTNRGEKTAVVSCGTSLRSPAGTRRDYNWTEWTTRKDTNPATCGLYRPLGTHETSAVLGTCRTKSTRSQAVSTNLKKRSNSSERNSCEVFDVVNCGPRNRFTIRTELGPMIVHNSGYGMGPDKAVITWAGQGVKADKEMASKAIYGYREKYDMVPKLWRALEQAAKDAIRNPGSWFSAGKRLAFLCRPVAGIQYLIMRLPSGRCLFYPRPEIVREMNERLGRETDRITYYGKIKGKVFGRIDTWGGALLENASQATAGDLLVSGSLHAEGAGFLPFLPVHDQLLSEFPAGATAAQYVSALTILPDWAEGLPLKAEGKFAPYYAK